MSVIRPTFRPQPVEEPTEAPRMRKYANSGVLYPGENQHPMAPFLSGPCTIEGKKYRAKVFRNRGRAKDGGDLITIIFEDANVVSLKTPIDGLT